jgi:hypothetical protein
MIDTRLSDELSNLALKRHNITIQDIRKESPDLLITIKDKKGKDRSEYYYNVYTIDSEEEYLAWREKAESLAFAKGYNKKDLDNWEMINQLKETYIYKELKLL